METGTGLVRALIAAVEVCFTHPTMFIEQNDILRAYCGRSVTLLVLIASKHSDLFCFLFFTSLLSLSTQCLYFCIQDFNLLSLKS